MIKNYLQIFALLMAMGACAGCKKDSNHLTAQERLVQDAQSYMEAHIKIIDRTELMKDSGIFARSCRRIMWEKGMAIPYRGVMSLLVPITYPNDRFISSNLDSNRLFSTRYLQELRIWPDSAGSYHHELMTYFPDSSYHFGSPPFSGIVRVTDWSGNFIRATKLTHDGRKIRLAPMKDARMVQLCYYSSGYNYTEGGDPVYWSIDLGCSIFVLEDAGHSTAITDNTYYWNMDGGSMNGFTGTAIVPNIKILGGNNIIGNVRDYNKCFDNIAGFGQHYSVTLCVSQPVPGTRSPWGFVNGNSSNGSGDLVSAGHTFLVLSQWDMMGRVTRNVGFYPKTGASPISPVDQGQLNNDENHSYDVSLTFEIDNSKFFTILDFISHGNDEGYNYDLNSNNCSTFAIRALRSAGINTEFTAGKWPGGEGFNPGDLGEDIRSLILSTGMTKSTQPSAHFNWGICY